MEPALGFAAFDVFLMNPAKLGKLVFWTHRYPGLAAGVDSEILRKGGLYVATMAGRKTKF